MQIRDFKIINFGSGLPGKKLHHQNGGYIYIYIYYNPVTLLLDTLSPSTNSSGRFWVSNRVSPGRALHIDVQLPAKKWKYDICPWENNNH
jgi:hypothetical protein